MNLAYIYPEELPSKYARTISVINTANEISKLANCTLVIPSLSKSDNEIFNFYNIKNSSLIIHKITKKICGIKSNKIYNYNLSKLIAKENFDIIYVRHLKAASFLLSIKNRKFKIIFECHEIFCENISSDASKNKIEKLTQLEKHVYLHVDGLTFINKSLQEKFNTYFDQICPLQKVAYNGIYAHFPHIKKDFSQCKSIYYVGNFMKWKGLEDAIKALLEVKNIELNIIGGDNQERTYELKQLSSSLKIENRVNFMGFKQSKEVEEILSQNAKITIIPNTVSSWNEYSLPLKLLEYMITSNIVISADMKTVQEIIKDGKNGFLFKSGNIKDFAKTIQKVLAMDESSLQSITKNAYEDAKNHTWTKRAENIIEFAKEIF